jgi:hypothetical protein
MEEEEATSTLWLGNLDPHKVTRRIIYEVGIHVSRERAELAEAPTGSPFPPSPTLRPLALLQGGPVRSIALPMLESNKVNRGYAFVEYESVESAAYAVSLLRGNLSLFDRPVRVAFGGQAKAGGGAGGARRPSLGGEEPPRAAQQAQHLQQAQTPEQAYAASMAQQYAAVQQQQAYAGMLLQQQAAAAAAVQQQYLQRQQAAMAAHPAMQQYGGSPGYAYQVQAQAGPGQMQQQQYQQQQYYVMQQQQPQQQHPPLPPSQYC